MPYTGSIEIMVQRRLLVPFHCFAHWYPEDFAVRAPISLDTFPGKSKDLQCYCRNPSLLTKMGALAPSPEVFAYGLAFSVRAPEMLACGKRFVSRDMIGHASCGYCTST